MWVRGDRVGVVGVKRVEGDGGQGVGVIGSRVWGWYGRGDGVNGVGVKR